MLGRLKIFFRFSQNRFLNNLSWQLLEKTLQILNTLFIGAWVARYLGVVKFGVLSYALAYNGLFLTLTTLGLDTLLVKYLVKNHRIRNYVVGTTFYLKILASFIIFILIYISLNLTNQSNEVRNLVLILASSNIALSFNVLTQVYEAAKQTGKVAKSNIVAILISAAIKVTFIILKLPIIYFAVSYLVDVIIKSLINLFSYEKDFSGFIRWRFKKNIAFIFLKNSWPLITSGLIISIYMRIDIIMIETMIGSEAAGLYSVAEKLSTFSYFLPTILMALIFPDLIEMKKQGNMDFSKKIEKIFEYFFYLGVVVAILVFLLGQFVIDHIYGSEFANSVDILKIHALTLIFVFMGIANNRYLIIEGLQKIDFFYKFAGLVINLVANYFLIDRLGPVGAAYGTLIAYIFISYLSMAISSKTRATFFMQTRSLYPKNILIKLGAFR